MIDGFKLWYLLQYILADVLTAALIGYNEIIVII